MRPAVHFRDAVELDTLVGGTAIGDATQSGIPAVGALKWGTHFCHFYRTTSELLRLVAEYFRAGLENHELCIWVVSTPITVSEALGALRDVIPNVHRHLSHDEIEVISGHEWTQLARETEQHLLAHHWDTKVAEALERGFVGVRASGGIPATRFASAITPVGNQHAVFLCTCEIEHSSGAMVLDALRTHDFATVFHGGTWEFLTRAASWSHSIPREAQRTEDLGRRSTDAMVLSEREREARDRRNILAALERAHWKIYGPGGAAELLGIKPTTLSSRMKRFAIQRPH